MLLHETPDFSDLIAVTGRTLSIAPALIEKDYWLMHCLWGLQQMGLKFELKGGTSLSKGFSLIHRFSEDIDIHIYPATELRTGKNHDKPKDVAARRAFYDELAGKIAVPGITDVSRDTIFDDERYYRSGGIRLAYASVNPLPDGIKEGILLEAGFDQVAPNQPRTISSWAYDQAVQSGLARLTDNRAVNVPCYEPGYTLVEKLQTISTKYRQHKGTGLQPQNFMRHYYDVYCLLTDTSVQAFIGMADYQAHKTKRFPKADEPDLTKNEAFLLSDPLVRDSFEAAYVATKALYYRDQPSFASILERISDHLPRL